MLFISDIKAMPVVLDKDCTVSCVLYGLQLKAIV